MATIKTRCLFCGQICDGPDVVMIGWNYFDIDGCNDCQEKKNDGLIGLIPVTREHIPLYGRASWVAEDWLRAMMPEVKPTEHRFNYILLDTIRRHDVLEHPAIADIDR